MKTSGYTNVGPVVLGLDERPLDEQQAGLHFAAAEAERRNATLVLAHGCQPLVSTSTVELPDEVVERRRQGSELLAAAAVAARALLGPDRAVKPHLGHGTGVNTLLDLSARAGLIVLQRRRVGRLERWLTGSTTTRVAAEAGCSVVVVRADHDNDIDVVRTGVVCGVDERGHASLALAAAFAEAELRKTTLVVAHAWQMADLPLTYGYIPPDSEELAGQQQRAEVELAEALAGFAAEHPDVVLRREVTNGTPQGVLDGLTERAELLVVGRHGNARLPALLLGGVARHAIAHAPCPVMVVPAARVHRSGPRAGFLAVRR